MQPKVNIKKKNSLIKINVFLLMRLDTKNSVKFANKENVQDAACESKNFYSD